MRLGFFNFTPEQRIAAFQSRSFVLDYDSDQSRDIAGWWPLAGEGGDANDWDYSGYNTHGTRANSPTRKAVLNPRWGGVHALDLDGDDQHTDLGTIGTSHPLQLDTGVLTISGWFLQRDGGDSFQRLIDKSTAGNAANGWGLYIETSDRTVTFMCGGFDAVVDSVTSAYEFDVWNHVVLTYTEASGLGLRRIFINGVNKRLSDDTKTVPTASANARIGTWNHSTGREFDGMLSDIRAYNRALRAGEAYDLFANPHRAVYPIGVRTFSFGSVSAATEIPDDVATWTMDVPNLRRIPVAVGY